MCGNKLKTVDEEKDLREIVSKNLKWDKKIPVPGKARCISFAGEGVLCGMRNFWKVYFAE